MARRQDQEFKIDRTASIVASLACVLFVLVGLVYAAIAVDQVIEHINAALEGAL